MNEQMPRSLGEDDVHVDAHAVRRCRARHWFIAFVLCLCGSGGVQAQYACEGFAGERAYDNPCPSEGDLSLPMPGGRLQMVFRHVDVPGGNFWGHPARNLELGDPEARIFEAPRLVSVAGSFPTEDGKGWSILIGKYEVSVAQYASVIGEGNLRLGLERLAAGNAVESIYRSLLDDSISKAQARRLLASPVRGLRPVDLLDFTHRYTEWCYADETCVSRLPRFGAMPGFFRLPTEVEWEYTARRHSALDERVSFLPFDVEQASAYAYLSSASRVREGPTSIGRFAPTTFGVHDLYGNVTELIDGRFYAELGQGKPGMHVARGESYAYEGAPDGLRPSRRVEIQAYRQDDDGVIVPLRSARLGMRLAIGSQTVPDVATFDALESTYREYRSTDRLQSASGRSTQADVLNTAEPLRQIDKLLEEHARKTNLSSDFVEEVMRLTESARLNLVRSSEALAEELARRTARIGAEAGRHLFRQRKAQEVADSLAEAASTRDVESRLLDRARAQASSYGASFREEFIAYADNVSRLAGYRQFALEALDRLSGEQSASGLDVALALLSRHVEDVLDGEVERDRWERELRDRFDDDTLFDAQQGEPGR